MKVVYRCIQCGSNIVAELPKIFVLTHTCPKCGVENLYRIKEPK